VRPEQRVVISLPLTEVWDAAGPVAATRGRRVGVPEITLLLRHGPVRFIVAEAGPLRWIPLDQTHAFWKSEAKPRLVAADVDGFRLDDFPRGARRRPASGRRYMACRRALARTRRSGAARFRCWTRSLPSGSASRRMRTAPRGQMVAALNHLAAERAHFILRLRAYAGERRVAKGGGQRQPPAGPLAAIFPPYRTSPDDGSP
jgi:hypothetical protein